MNVKSERSGWRDESISLRHRSWGFDCPAVDIDFLMIEYDRQAPVALVEYKNERALPENFRDSNFSAIIELGNGYRGGIPVFNVRYSSDLTTFTVTGLNNLAKAWVPFSEKHTEREYVSLIYKIRGRVVPKMVLERLEHSKDRRSAA